MPSLFRLFGYVIFFWSNEGAPLEPVHVHVAKGVPNASATKIWITEAGGCIVANNNSKIPARTLSAAPVKKLRGRRFLLCGLRGGGKYGTMN